MRHEMGSPGPSQGQWGSRYAIHAGRQLSGKVSRYLKRVIVTPAVDRRLTGLEPGLTNRHWAGVSPCTHPYGLAGTYVFIKQSLPPSHCDQPLARLAPLIPKIRGQFAEFPWLGYPRHALGFSPRGTCVGSRYGHGGSFLFPFSWAPGLRPNQPTGWPFLLSPGSPHYGSPPVSGVRQGDSLARSSPKRRERDLRCRTYLRGAGILTCFPFGLFELRQALGPANPGLTNIAREP